MNQKSLPLDKRKRPGTHSTTITIRLAQRLYRAGHSEAGYPRDAWALARRLAGYLRRPRVGPLEELAFCRLGNERLVVSWFRANRRGNLKNFVSLSFKPS